MKKAPSPEDDTTATPLEVETAPDEEADLLELLLDAAPPPPVIPSRIDGVVVGRLAGFSAGGQPLVVLARGATPVVARALASLRPEDAGRQVALMFESGDATKPMVMGIVHDLGVPAPTRLEARSEDVATDEPAPDQPAPGAAAPERTESSSTDRERERAAPVEITQGDERVVLSAEKEIVLRCGKASITLTRAGKILIKGAYVSSRASGTNRIVGGTVEIN